MPIGIPGYIILRVAGGLGWCWGAGTPPSVRDPPPPGDERTRVAVGKRAGKSFHTAHVEESTGEGGSQCEVEVG